MLQSSELEFLMEAHNGLSARIAEEAGFAGVWASGLSMSAQFGVRDSNEASWTQVVDMIEFMTDATSVPILLDGDTGYGNFNNLRRLVRKLEQRQVAGVCIEDKIFPKTNSFIDGNRQPLADIDEFCGKIKAGKDIQNDPDFCIVARVEALIAGWGLEEALKRAEAYRQAGADAILIHSSRNRPDEILAFSKEWAGRGPLVIVPTKYYSTPTEVFRRAGISLVIWANHLMRASLASMQAVAAKIHETQSVADIEDRIAPIKEVFRIQGADELDQAEQRYIRSHSAAPRAIVLAASRGQDFASLTDSRPKSMLTVAGKPLLRRLVDQLKGREIHDITVVAGYRPEAIDLAGVTLVENPEHEQSGELASLAKANLEGDCLVVYGDLLFRSYILRDLLETEGNVVVTVDSAPQSRTSGAPDFAVCSAADDRTVFQNEVRLVRLTGCDDADRHGRWVGMALFRQGALTRVMAELQSREDFQKLGMRDLLNHLVETSAEVKVHYIHGHWLDVNSLEDLELAQGFAR